MIPLVTPTMEMRFKKSQPSLEAKLAGGPAARPQIFLQQKFYVQTYDESNKQDMLIPPGAPLDQIIPPMLMPHVEAVGQSPEGLVVKVPAMVKMEIVWKNVPAVDDNAPDVEPVQMKE